MNRKIVALILSALVLSSCARMEQWFEADETVDIDEFETEEDPEEDPSEEINFEEQERQELISQLPDEAYPDDWNLILVNNWTPLPENFDVELVEADNEQLIDERIVEAWNEWQQAAAEAGHSLFFASGYRSVERQTNNYNNRIQRYIQEGYSEEEAIQLTEEYIAIPNHSEHHTGLALDIVDQEWIADGQGLIPEYDTQESQQWLVETMQTYGFVLRYPEGKEEITDINYESWHFRYVGQENAEFMVEHDLVLEEYHNLLEERQSQSME